MSKRRDDWMTDAFLARDGQKSASSQPGNHSRELNPHWRTGNNGLPTNDSTPSSSATPVNSWTKMKVKSALGMIERGEGSLEELAKERFGSVEEFCALCKLCGFSAPLKQGAPKQPSITIPTPSRQSLIEEEKRAAANEKMVNYVAKRREKEEAAVSKCSLCDCEDLAVVSEADYTFLARPKSPINSRHFLIIPRQHEESTLECGAAVLNEIRNYKKSLIRFYASVDCDPVFVELRRRVADKRQHVAIECFAVPRSSLAMDVRVYLRKQVCDAESYWATHKAIIECPEGLARALPRRPFPFLHIDLWTHSFAHIIEDDRRFPASWPRDTVGRLCLGGDGGNTDDDYGPFDWTVALRE